MKYVEFVGPPGAGKSTIHSRLIREHPFFGGVEQDAIRRLVLDRYGSRHRLAYRAMPSDVRTFFDDELLEYRFRRGALAEFLRSHPDYLTVLSTALDPSSHDRRLSYWFWKEVCENYRLGKAAAESDEILCLDESFAQSAVSLLWRCPRESFSVEEYFRTVPTPDLLIHIDAPADMSIDRQRERGEISVARNWETDDFGDVQERLRDICIDVREHMRTRTYVATITNTETIDHAVDEIETICNRTFDHRS